MRRPSSAFLRGRFVVLTALVGCGAGGQVAAPPAATVDAPASTPPPPRANAKPGQTTPLHKAAEGGDLEQVKALVAARPTDASAPDERGLTPLHLACSKDKIE